MSQSPGRERLPPQRLLLVTGRLAEPSCRRVADELNKQGEFDCAVSVLGISVAALMTTTWVARKLELPGCVDRIILPGFCAGDLKVVQAKTGANVELGPRDLRDLPAFLGRKPTNGEDYGAYDIEILAEINHAPRLTPAELLKASGELVAAGADVIDVGCNPGEIWGGIGEAVRALKEAGYRVSVDSLEPREIAAACEAGAELVLSVNHSNRDAAGDWGREVVVIPDEPDTLIGVAETVEFLEALGVKYRIDPVLSPIGFGFAASLQRYAEVRRLFPRAELLMGIGNLTELTDVDSAGVNVLLMAFCQELGIRSVLTTQVINWARSSVAECDVARRLVRHAVNGRMLPKHVDPRLVMLRDPRVFAQSPEELDELARAIKDHNYRVFVAGGQLHLISHDLHLSGRDPFDLLAGLAARQPKNLDASHAFYLGYELCKAATALALGKDYRQDQALSWGMLTVPETEHRGVRSEE